MLMMLMSTLVLDWVLDWVLEWDLDIFVFFSARLKKKVSIVVDLEKLATMNFFSLLNFYISANI